MTSTSTPATGTGGPTSARRSTSSSRGWSASSAWTSPPPTAIEVDGRAGQAVTLSPADVDPATCDEGTVSPWFEADGDSRFYAAPGETETVWIVDLDGRRAVLNAGSVVEVPPATRAQLDEMLASIRIG